MELQSVLELLTEFNGVNHSDLARKHKLTTRAVYQLTNRAAQASIVAHLSEYAESPVEILWAAPLSKLGSLEGCIAVLQAAQKALDNGYPISHRAALAFLPPSFALATQGSNQAEPSIGATESQPNTQAHKSDLLASESLQQARSDSPSMSPFTIFLGRLVEHLGAEISAELTREFAGQTIQFPITQDYTAIPKSITRFVSRRMSVVYMGTEYDVSHIPGAAVGEAITVNPTSLPCLHRDRLACAAEPLQASSLAGEMNPAAADRQGQLNACELLASCRHTQACRLHKCAHSPEDAECPIFCRTQALQPAHETQSDMHPVDLVNVDQS